MELSIGGPQIDPNAGLVCESILRSLPAWFGIEAALQHYIQAAARMPTLIAWEGETAAGFLTLLQHNPYSAEIYVIGVRPTYRRCGVGRALVQRCEVALRELGVEYLQVKTLADTHPDSGYAETRAFYAAVGFRPLEVFPALWDENNPCLLMVKALQP
jgi:ribosomal protein S18 acetylase RimI-like enzyme